MDPVITVSANDEYEGLSDVNSAFNNDKIPTVSVAMLEDNYTNVSIDSKLVIANSDPSNREKYGYISNVKSNENYTFSISPQITLSYSMPSKISIFPVYFDVPMNEYATDFSLSFYLNKSLVKTISITKNTSSNVDVSVTDVDSFDTIVLTVTKWSHKYHRCVIGKIGGARINDFYLDFNSASEKPFVSSITPVKGLDVKYYTYYAETSTSEIGTAISDSNGIISFTHDAYLTKTVNYTYPEGNPVNVAWVEDYPTSTKIKYTYQSNGLPASGIESKLIGNKISSVENSNYIEYNSKGIEIKEFKNPLVCTKEHSTLISEWLNDYIIKASTLKVDYRGNPELEPFDMIYMQSQFEDYVVTRLKSTQISFGNGTSGSLEVIKI